MRTGNQIYYSIKNYIDIAKRVINRWWTIDDAKDLLEDEYYEWYKNFYLPMAKIKKNKIEAQKLLLSNGIVESWKKEITALTEMINIVQSCIKDEKFMNDVRDELAKKDPTGSWIPTYYKLSLIWEADIDNKIATVGIKMTDYRELRQQTINLENKLSKLKTDSIAMYLFEQLVNI